MKEKLNFRIFVGFLFNEALVQNLVVCLGSNIYSAGHKYNHNVLKKTNQS